MPQSLDLVYLHTIFSTKDRHPYFQTPEQQRDLHAYLASVSNNLNCPATKVGGVADHVHMLTRLPRTLTIADFVKEVKRVSSECCQLSGTSGNFVASFVGFSGPLQSVFDKARDKAPDKGGTKSC